MPKLMDNAGDNPVLQDMIRLLAVLIAIVDNVAADVLENHFQKLKSWDDEYMSTNSSIVQQMIESTTYQEKTLNLNKGKLN